MFAKTSPEALNALKPHIRAWGRELGFNAVGFASIQLDGAENELMAWLAAGYHGDMDYMARHGATRARPAELLPGTASIISARMDYRPDAAEAWANLADPERAYISRYALGRDYHKLIRSRLQQLGERIEQATGAYVFRAFSDSAPIMEVELAKNAALGWKGKHTLLLDRGGSWFFLGELFVDLPFTPDPPATNHCGTCQNCIDICPTRAILAPYLLDARRCISYLTIEHAGAIPLELRALIGNRIYGCDDCQLACPWNRFAQTSAAPDFQPRNQLDTASLLELFAWTEAEFLRRHEGSAIRRIGHERWLRNIAVALGNALAQNASNATAIVAALQARADHPSALLREHLQWALSQQGRTQNDKP
ncbi:MAG: tRNA epoxyqueuosine(34) reductase QueG [Hydrogenophilales bacterium 28-61-23]|nr:MAG: tRNA epoxyqueuosine(34) reductase QueG [Hydrogenophilales bacterium 28-61-23]